MDYEAFKEAVLAGVQEIYGGTVVAKVKRVLKNNGSHYEGIVTALREEEERACIAIPLKWFYWQYRSGEMSVESCVRMIHKTNEEYKELGNVLMALKENQNWEQMKGKIYPILLSTKENQEMLESLASTPMLDLSVAYIVREKIADRCLAVKVDYTMLEAYGGSVEQLHRQALKNLMGDGYQFCGIHSFAANRGCQVPEELDITEPGQEEKVYILSNTDNFYGAAGILDRKLVRKFADGRDFFILPASIHKTIFVLAEERSDMRKYNGIVRLVNRTTLSADQKLSDHAYFYDGMTDEIRMCA